MEDREDFATAIAAQPHWMRQVASLDLGRPKAWAPNDTVVVVGMGSSTNAGAVFVEAMRAIGRRAVNIDASAVAHYPQGFMPGEHLIVISESGRSPEPIAAAKRFGVPNPIVVTNVPGSSVTALSDHIVPLGGYKDSGVYTIGYTTTLVALAAIARAHGADLGDPVALASAAEATLAQFTGALADDAAALDKALFLDIVGQGTSAGSAQAAALLFRESCGLPTAFHQTQQYLHGPMEACGAASAILLFGDARELAAASQLRESGALTIGFAAHPGDEAPGLHRLETKAEGLAGAASEVVFAQLLACELSAIRNRQVGHFKFEQQDTKLPA